MTWGKSILFAVFTAAMCASSLPAGEAVPSRPDAGWLTSLRDNTSFSVGGEVHVDFSVARGDSHAEEIAPHRTNLRLLAETHPNIKATLKLDLGGQVEIHGRLDEIVEEAMLVMSAVGGTGVGFFAGRGRAPYGQDVTLGMLQSYHHVADQEDSSEGRIFITDPPETGGGGREIPPMRPGQLDRVLAAGLHYEWEDRWKVELAVFQPNSRRYESRLEGWDEERHTVGTGAAARVWWMPFEDFVLQASVLALRSGAMATMRLREDMPMPGLPDARGENVATALSVGFDYRIEPWRIFGEYQHGRDWNFTKGYDTDTWQLGAAYSFARDWRVGAAVEGLHIRDAARGLRTDFLRGVLNIRRRFENGLFVLAEYGHERRRRRGAGSADKAFGNFFGVRLGYSF